MTLPPAETGIYRYLEGQTVDTIVTSLSRQDRITKAAPGQLFTVSGERGPRDRLFMWKRLLSNARVRQVRQLQPFQSLQ
jgi:hypothetical protein